MARTITASVFCPECCEEAPQPPCCMYPAQALIDGLYSAADLPNTLDITNIVNDSPITVRVNKSGSSYPFTFNYPSGGSINLTLLAQDDSWQFDPQVDEWDIWRNPCLITDEAGISVKDTFSDTYTFSTAVLGGISITLTRQSLCEWKGTVLLDDPPFPHQVRLIYSEGSDPSITGSAFRPIWVVVVEISGGVNWFKINLSSPEGTYSDPDGAYANATIS